MHGILIEGIKQMTKDNLEFEGLQPYLRATYPAGSLLHDLGCFGCYFFCLAIKSGMLTPELDRLCAVWMEAKSKQYINVHDELVEKAAVLALFGRPGTVKTASDDGDIGHFKAFSGVGSHYRCLSPDIDTETRRNRKIIDYRRTWFEDGEK
ncbi:MAG: hypothetical protein Ta2A_11590 [Treponemataceae bacterium]|nr:MAG: hypothetical protein Ta2A_11590 [Treponemataceae bacterium]